MSDLSSIVPGFPGSNGYGLHHPVNRNGSPGVNQVQGTSRISGSTTGVDAAAAAAGSRIGDSDSVQVSDFARLLDQARRLPDVRLDRIAHARQAIANGEYDADDVLNHTIDRIFEEEEL
jgi:flagellar biosynthesis anti-sigma factor FlgM